jgi:hypothetical protein
VSTTRSKQHPRPRTSSGTVRALVAAGSSPAGRRTLDGELVWIPLPCGRTECTCIGDFSGVATRGITDVARVSIIHGTSRASVRRAIMAGMCGDCVPQALKPGQAERLLRAADCLADGTLVHRDAVGAIVPFPTGTTITPDGHVVAPRAGAAS